MRRCAAALVLALVAVACTRDEGGRPGPSTTSTSAVVRGGMVRVGVSAAPDPGAPALGGAAVRALVLPQLFVAEPDGRWTPSLVAAGSDRAAPDGRSASFRLREGAAWSDGSPITADDLRRTADARFVAGVDGPAPDGTITVRFTSALPGWRRLWSGADSVGAPRPDLWGGPFVVASTTPGLETVLRPNPGWKGDGPFLDEVRLVLVPDATMARQLLARGELDVVAPPAETNRTGKLDDVDGVVMRSAAAGGGWWVGLFLHSRLGIDDRRAVMASVDRRRFVSTLLAREATLLDGFSAAKDATWSTVAKGDTAALRGDAVDLVGTIEEPMTALLHRSMQKAVRAGASAGRLELRAAESDRVEGWMARGEFDAAVVPVWDGPSVCWTCRWSSVDAGLAAAADAGDAAAVSALQSKLRDEALLLPLWRPRAAVAWRTSAVGPLRANPYGLSAAWDAWRWSRPAAGGGR